jgi:two-component system, OmpR family, sensor histidine kinase KdpD
VKTSPSISFAKSALLPDATPRRWVGLVAAVASIAVITVAIYPLRQVTPAVSTGVVYLLAVLFVSTFWGMALGVLTAVGSAAAFNWFHIPPTGRFTIAEGENWVALGVFLAAAVLTSTVSGIARARAAEAEMRRREADLAAELARLLLGGSSVASTRRPAARLLAQTLGLPSAAIEMGAVAADERRIAVPLAEGDEVVATLLLPAGTPAEVLDRVHSRIAPAMRALLIAALEREALLAEVVETQALRRSDDIKTALLRAVSHDLRSPLTTIVAAAETLQSPSLEAAEASELAQAISADADRLSHLVDQLLDLSRLQAGAAEPRRDWCSLEEIVRAAVDDLGAASDVRVAMDPDLPLIEADAAQLERAFANLIDNARRYSAGEPVLIRARASGNRIRLRVVDRGPGIPRREQERIFEPFYQAADGAGGRDGSGLGLAIVKGFIELNGGTVHAESLPGQGTSFVVEFPMPSDAPTASLAEGTVDG